MAATAAFVVDEVAVERGVMGDDLRIADEVHQVVHDLVELGRVPNLVVSDAVDLDGVRRDQPLRVDEAVKRPAGRQQVLDLDAADLDQPVARLRVEAGGFGVQNDLARHGPLMGVFADFRKSQGRRRRDVHKGLSTFSTTART